MAWGNLVVNRSLGRVTQFAENVNGNDPANSALILIPWSSTATGAVIKDLDTVADIEANVNTAERAAGGWNRKTLTDASGITITYDDTNDRVDVDCPDQTWTAVAAGNDSTDVSFNYDPDTTAGTDANIIPCTLHTFAITTDGSDITALIANFYRAA